MQLGWVISVNYSGKKMYVGAETLDDDTDGNHWFHSWPGH